MRRPPFLSCVILFILFDFIYFINKSVVICRISSVVCFVWMLSMIICAMKVDMMWDGNWGDTGDGDGDCVCENKPLQLQFMVD